MHKFKQDVIRFDLALGYDLTFNVSDSKRRMVRAVCRRDCKFKLYASWDKRRATYVVKTVNNHYEHYLKSYEGAIFPCQGERHWPQHNFPLDPPNIIIGLNRKRDPHEDPKKPDKLSNMVYRCPVALADNMFTTKGHALTRTKQASDNQRGKGADQE
ncbi:hypothetical protein Cgig2_021168 [Carnegiea gigantea]|uniref:Transposase MuDR plant domain-containing protein n=1 Tax=Carnegiea gigantea TaxID=171969 RepID=A0A9Q1KXN0_9CARY|nr:hypothetical protein Cgig2_021168 [Carnegiea gigantea]